MTLIDLNLNVQGYDYVGSLVGRLQGGTITGCGVEGGTVSGEDFVGALVGYNRNSTISNCYATGNVSGVSYVGGLVGSNYSYSTISNCYATGTVTGTGIGDPLVRARVGGLVGYNYYGTISNCYAAGAVTGTGDYVGGLAGDNSSGTITNCYAAGAVTGSYAVGGFAGYNSGTFSFSFWDTDTSGMTEGVGIGNDDYLYGLSTGLMQMHLIYDIAGWDFVNETANGPNDIWTIHDTVDYPQHVWEIVNFIG